MKHVFTLLNLAKNSQWLWLFCNHIEGINYAQASQTLPLIAYLRPPMSVCVYVHYTHSTSNNYRRVWHNMSPANTLIHKSNELSAVGRWFPAPSVFRSVYAVGPFWSLSFWSKIFSVLTEDTDQHWVQRTIIILTQLTSHGYRDCMVLKAIFIFKT